jgi:hypothetical protein
VRKILDTFPGAEVRDVKMIDPPVAPKPDKK